MVSAEEILEKKIIAIARGVSSEQILKTAEALLQGGVRLMEVTFSPVDERKSEETLRSIELLKRELGKEMHIGAGTVLTCEQVVSAKEAGAEYIISPHMDTDVIRKTKEMGLLSMPGVLSPTEAVTAWNAGCDFVKLFPAGNLGAGYIRALLSSLSQLKMIAVGGINETNIPMFRECGCAGFGIGGNLVDACAVREGNFAYIRKQAEKMVDALDVPLS